VVNYVMMTEDAHERVVRAVDTSLKHERGLRDQLAAARGWAVHPNDMELGPADRVRVRGYGKLAVRCRRI
jgi:hypothetical protein